MSAGKAVADRRELLGLDALKHFAEEIAATVVPGDILALYGEVGTGKTAFVQQLAAALGVTDAVTSPTFTIVSEYHCQKGTIKKLVHIDVYRLTPAEAKRELAVQAALQQAHEDARLTVIEWADRLEELLPAQARRLEFDYGKKTDQRTVIIRR